MVASGLYLRLFVINTVMTGFFFTVGSIELSMSNSVGEAFNCPAEVCRCGLDPRGRVKVVCDRGDLGDPIPIRAMDPLTEVLIIAAPDDKPNSLTIGPIFQSLAKLEQLKITNSFVPAIGKHSFWGLRSLRTLDLSLNNISALVESNFRGLITLEDLLLDGNIIDSIPSAAFRHLPALKRLSLARNHLSEFVPRLFYGLHRLEELELSDNPLQELEPEVFRDVRLLRTLRCRRCRLTYINPLLLHLLPDIVTLDLGENGFHYLDKNAFGDLPKLRHLYLDGNQVTVLTSGVLTGHNLTTLSLARNRMMTVDPAAFVNVSVTELDLSSNRLQSLDPFVFLPLNQSLRRLKIGANPLQVSHLWSSILSPRVQLNLSELDVADIPIGRDQHFQTDLFSFHHGIKSLNLSGTAFNYLPVEVIRSLPSLRQLDLSFNKLSSLTDLSLSALSALQGLRRIYLHGNPWYCDACVIGPMLKWLDISPASRHIKDGCRGLKTNAGNLTADYINDDGAQPCPVCQDPPSVAGVELPRLDHVNLPTCNYPPMLIDSQGLPSKPATAAGATLTPMGRFVIFLENPLYLALVCGVAVLLVAAVCAALAIVSRHAASYYTNEGKRSKTGQPVDPAVSDESEGLFPLTARVGHRGRILKVEKKATEQRMDAIENESQLLSKNNNGRIKDETAEQVSPSSARTNGVVAITVTSRGVHCPAYPPVEQPERSLF
ncbi:insulin-like growth factor-binding protein complex acid labile subunit [Daphnia magna]|uniref:Leucine-rich repeat-containing protein n=1 Tax=Daphnia magna TaxID=35525 RepID=A0A0P4YDI6_9CRUS|nr:insulin-like growth factor-binding protein complex acid labile subunit [Daphnia magna]